MVIKTALTILVFALAGCVQISSHPPGADVVYGGKRVGKTPYQTGAPPGPFYGSTGEVSVELPGYVIDSVRFGRFDMNFLLRPEGAGPSGFVPMPIKP